MTWGGRGLPCQMGSMKRQPALKLAMDCIDLAIERSKTSKAKFCVTLDPTGNVFVEWVQNANAREWVATITRKSNPDWLAEELGFEWGRRNGARA